jgi:hypothetical protein
MPGLVDSSLMPPPPPPPPASRKSPSRKSKSPSQKRKTHRERNQEVPADVLKKLGLKRLDLDVVDRVADLNSSLLLQINLHFTKNT